MLQLPLLVLLLLLSLLLLFLLLSQIAQSISAPKRSLASPNFLECFCCCFFHNKAHDMQSCFVS
jgi:hypothetical protein